MDTQMKTDHAMQSQISHASQSSSPMPEAASLCIRPLTHPSDCRDLAAAINEALSQLSRVIAALDPAQYASKTCDLAFGASIGRHVRHILDHLAALDRAVSESCVADYEARARDSRLETDPALALAEVARLRERLNHLAGIDADRPTTISIAITRDRAKATLPSTLAREMSFVLSHTVHHHAIVRTLLCELGLGASIEPDFGLAPGTPRSSSPASDAPPACAR